MPLLSNPRPIVLCSCALILLLAPPLFAGAAVCGNGVLEVGEQCDDGGHLPLDGCDSLCRYEHVHLGTTFELEGGTAPGFCTETANTLGNAFSGLGLAAVNSVVADEIGSGRFPDLLTVLIDLDDPLGQDDAALEVGLIAGHLDPEDPSPGGLDAWYTADPSGLGEDGLPTSRFTPSSIVSMAFAGGPSTVDVPYLGTQLGILDARIAGVVGPENSTPAPPPAELAPGFTAFENLDSTGAADGLCGNVTVGSLATLPVPTDLGCKPPETCAGSREYVACADDVVDDTCHSLLDVLVGGCASTNSCLTMVTATQPDVGADGGSPALLEFQLNGEGIEKVVVVEPDDAYSSWFTFATTRVHFTDNVGVVFRDGFESGDVSAWE